MLKAMTSFVDFTLIIVLSLLFMLVCAISSIGEKYRQEYQTKVELLEREKKAQAQPGPGFGETDLFLTLTRDGKVVVEGKALSKKSVLRSVEEIDKVLGELRPTRAYLRVDKEVPTGVTQQVLLACEELGVMGFLATAQPGQGR